MPWISVAKLNEILIGRSLGGLASAGVGVFIGGVVTVIVLTLIAGIRGLIILGQTFWLYPLVALIAIFALIFISKALRIRVLNKILGILAAVAICFFGFKAVTSYYVNGNMYFASIYSADYIQALPDGTAPALNEKRNEKGVMLAELGIGEKVTVNGISLNKKEYNITTANGINGWIPLAALPEDNADMLSINISVDGFDSEDIAIDRQVERLMERYMDVKETGGGAYVVHREYTISQNTLNRSIRVNAQTPLMAVESKEFKKGAELAESGAAVTLENIVYADDCTIIYLTVTDGNVRDLSGTFNTTAWKKSLIVTDIVTGEIWPAMQADYKQTWRHEQVSNGYKSAIVFFFPPFKSRSFSLTHEVLPIVSKAQAGYGGILGLAASITSGGSAATYLDYNFPEVQVR